ETGVGEAVIVLRGVVAQELQRAVRTHVGRGEEGIVERHREGHRNGGCAVVAVVAYVIDARHDGGPGGRKEVIIAGSGACGGRWGSGNGSRVQWPRFAVAGFWVGGCLRVR